MKKFTDKFFNKNKNVVKISMPGRDPISIEYQENDTAETVLQRANVTLKDGDSCALGRQRITDPKTTAVQPGDTLVITSKVANG